MQRIPRAPCTIVLFSLLACDRPAPPKPSEASANAAPSASASASPSTPPATLPGPLLASLREAAVHDGAFARRTLFTWTTREQGETLRRGRKLLLGNELPIGPAPYVQLLENAAAKPGVPANVARLLLLHPSLKLRRYAWTRPWPTRFGLGGRDYGPELVRVVLQANAYVLRFDPDSPEVFTAHDLDDRPVPIGDALSDPSRIAAVYFVRTGGGTEMAHREYVLCNESAIEQWSLATPAVKEALRDDLALAKELAATPPNAVDAKTSWRGPASDDASVLYMQSMAADDPRYRPTGENLRALVDALAKVDADEPAKPSVALEVTPTARFLIEAEVADVHVRRPPGRVTRVTRVI